jgi:hypothetical protein
MNYLDGGTDIDTPIMPELAVPSSSAVNGDPVTVTLLPAPE